MPPESFQWSAAPILQTNVRRVKPLYRAVWPAIDGTNTFRATTRKQPPRRVGGPLGAGLRPPHQTSARREAPRYDAKAPDRLPFIGNTQDVDPTQDAALRRQGTGPTPLHWDQTRPQPDARRRLQRQRPGPTPLNRHQTPDFPPYGSARRQVRSGWRRSNESPSHSCGWPGSRHSKGCERRSA